MSKRFPTINEFTEFPLTNDEINDVLSTMNGESMFNIDARRYEQSHDRYERMIKRSHAR